jgi:hypothetical protein
MHSTADKGGSARVSDYEDRKRYRNLPDWHNTEGFAEKYSVQAEFHRLYGFQDGPLFPFIAHLTPAKVPCILPENSKPGKRVIPFNQLIQFSNSRLIQVFRQNTLQPLPLIRKYPAHQFLECGVTGSDDFMRVKPDNQLCGDKAGCYITADNVNDLFFEL